MHLLIAAHDFHPDPGSGGTGRYVYETASRLSDRGHRVSVVTRRRGDTPRREFIEGIDVRRYEISIADRSADEILIQAPGAYRTVSQYVEELTGTEPPDLLSFQGPVTSLFVDRTVSDGVPRSCTFHSPWPAEYAIKTRNGARDSLSAPRRRINIDLRKRLEGRVLSRCDDVIALSAFMNAQRRRVYGTGDGERTGGDTVIPGGADVERFTPDAGMHECINGAPAFLTVRRLSERMGHGLLLRAFAAVMDDHPGARLYIAGDGPLREELAERAAELGVGERTTFLGYVPDRDLPSVYASADVFVLPTTELEGFGLATLEALASGTPVIATPVGGTREVLDGLDDDPMPGTTLLSRADADTLVRAMRAWAAATPDERTAAGGACRQYVCDRYTWKRTAAALESHYATLVT